MFRSAALAEADMEKRAAGQVDERESSDDEAESNSD
jgi:hypothetical protein